MNQEEAGQIWMGRAIELATNNVMLNLGGPFGAVVVRNGELLAEGANQVTRTNDPTAHAEVVAIREACRVLGSFSLTGCEIYASCEPCPMCLGAIYWARLDRIYYGSTAGDAAKVGFDDAVIYAEMKVETGSRSLPCTQLMAAEAAASFLAWTRSPLRFAY